VSDVLQRPGGRIDPIPEIKPYVAYSYLSGEKGRRDPFQSFYQEAVDEVELDANAGLTPEMERELRNRNREELEQYELDSLRMVGIMKNEESDWGIIMDPNGTVHRVRVGNYLGRNVGKIVNIFENRIEMREIFQNTQGRWEEREASVALNEVE
jgi:type IV pilus assembly protein PilP